MPLTTEKSQKRKGHGDKNPVSAEDMAKFPSTSVWSPIKGYFLSLGFGQGHFGADPSLMERINETPQTGSLLLSPLEN